MSAASAAFVSSFPAGLSAATDVALRRPPQDTIAIPGVKPASALEIRPAPDMVPFGIPSLDALTGGVPRGALTEMVGPASSGRTSVAMSLMAEITRRQEVCALIDVTDSFDPASAEAAGADLRRVLWVRCGKEKERSQASGVGSDHSRIEVSPRLNSPSTSESNAQRVHRAITSGCFEAARGRREPASLQSVAPPAKNISWSIHENYDARLRHAMVNGGEARASWSARQREVLIPTVPALRKQLARTPNLVEARKAKWARLDQALKATDLLIQSGGFGLIVIDLGDIPADQARRIPLTSWFRFRRAVENTPTILLVMARDSCAKTCASLVMNLSAEAKQSGQWMQESGAGSQEPATALLAHASLLDGLQIHVDLARTRLERKPVRSASAQVQTETSWRKSG